MDERLCMGKTMASDALKVKWPLADRAAVLFDLDGVLVDTAALHQQAWQGLADDLGLPFDAPMPERFRGVGRMECLDRLLGSYRQNFTSEEKRLLADRKNETYVKLIQSLSPGDLEPGVPGLLQALRDAGWAIGVVSASRNARQVIGLLGITDELDLIVDGAAVTRSKPDPQGFLFAAQRLGVAPQRCVVVEDAEAGVAAARAAGMRVVGVGAMKSAAAQSADHGVTSVAELSLEQLAVMAGLQLPTTERMRRRSA
jgi:beta-phosphoglucomutase